MAIQLISSDGSIITDQIGSCSWDITVPVNTENNLVYGGVVTWLQDYDFHVSPAGYYINNVFYESPEAFITLNPADPSLDRFDVIYVDADQVVKVLEGDPSITPSQPGLDLGLQLGLGVIFVEAGSSSPVDIVTECLTAWTPVASDGDIDVASANANCVDSSGIEATQAENGDYVVWDRGTTFNPSQTFNVITFRLRPKGDWSTDTNLNHRVKLQWYLSGIAVGSPVFIGDTAFSFSVTNPACQIVSIPVIQFGLSPTATVDQLRLTVVSEYAPPLYPFGFYMDGVCLQGGIFGATESDDIHNQYFGAQTPGRYWIQGNAKIEGWVTSPDIVNNSPSNNWSEKFGWGARAQGTGNTAVGAYSQANGQEGAVAVGSNAVANVGVAIGMNSIAVRGVAIGGTQTGSGGVAIGGGASCAGLSGVAIGGNANAGATSSIALGYGATTGGFYGAIAIGTAASNTGTFSLALGSLAQSTDTYEFVVGGTDAFSDYGYRNFYFGSGKTTAFPTNRFWSISGAVGTDTAGDTWKIAGAAGTGAGLSGPLEFQTSDAIASGTTLQSWTTKMALNSNTLGFYLDNTRFQMDEGVDVVAAGDLTLGTGNIFTITGTTDINAIINTNWQDGAVIYLLFSSTPTVKHDTVGGAGTSPIRLAGAVDFSTTANTVLALVYKDSYWREIGRTQASALGPYTFLNGLHEDLGGLVKLGGTLIEDTTITMGANDLIINEGTGNIKLQSLTNATTANVLFYDPITGNISYDSAPSGSGVSADNGVTENVANNLQWGGTLIQNTSIEQDNFTISFLNSGDKTFYSDPLNQIYQFGDIDNGAGGSFVSIDDAQSRFVFTVQAGRFLDVNKSTDTYSLGDIDTINDGGVIEMDNGNQRFKVYNQTTSYLDLNYGSGLFRMGVLDVGGQANFAIDSTNKTQRIFESRFQTALGAEVNAANDLVLSSNGNVIPVTGNTQINTITTTNWQAGSFAFLEFVGTPLIKNNQAGGGSTAGILLSGGVDFQVASGDTLSVFYDGINWHEIGRKSTASGGTGILSADNGLTLSTATNVQLGGTLLNDTQIANGAHTLTITGDTVAGDPILSITSTSTAATGGLQKGINVSLSGANANASENTYGIFALNNHSGPTPVNVGVYGEVGNGISSSAGVKGVSSGARGVWGDSSGGIGVLGSTTSGTAGSFGSTTGSGILVSTTSGTGATISSDSGLPLYISQIPSSTNTVVEIQRTVRGTTGTAANGIGAASNYYVEDTSGVAVFSNQIASKWTDATNASRTSQLDLIGVGTTATTTIMSAHGSGVVGIGISSGYTGTRLEVVDNSVGAASIVKVTSTSTAAASNLQRGLEVSLSGANANASQTTYGIYSSNTHTAGTNNYGVAGTASGSSNNYGVLGTDGTSASFLPSAAGVVGSGASHGVYGFTNALSGSAIYGYNAHASNGAGVHGIANGSSGRGVEGSSDAGTGVRGYADTGVPLRGTLLPSAATPSTIRTALHLQASSNSTGNVPGNGYGASILWNIITNNGGTTADRTSGTIYQYWVNATDASRTSNTVISNTLNAADVTSLILAGDGSMKLRPITATAASAITPAEGMIVIVSDTNGTFTSVGFWGYSGGAWAKF